MLLKFGFLSLILLLISCSSNNTKVEASSKPASLKYSVELKDLVPDPIASGEYKIVGKWSSQESNAMNCSDCRENDKGCCVVILNGKRYNRGQSFVLDNKGKVDSIYSYHIPEGVDLFSIEDFLRLYRLSLEERHQLTDGLIYWDKKLNAVIDNNDTITGLKVDQEYGYLYKITKDDLVQYEFKR